MSRTAPRASRSRAGRLAAEWPGAALAAALVLVAAALATSGDATRIEVLGVHHRSAESLAAALEPHVGPDGAITVHGGKLIVRATPERLARLRELLEQLDVEQRMLSMTVERRERRESERSGAYGSVRVEGGDARVEVGAGRGRETGDASDTQRLSVLEGMPAFIELGESRPVSTTIVVPGTAPVLAQGYADAVTGFEAVPTLTGDGVRLEIRFQAGRFAHRNAIEAETLSTTVTGPLGEWIELGGVVRELATRRSDLLGLARSLEERDVSVRVRVDPLDAP